MVNEKQIKKIIDDLVTPYNVKCGDGYVSPSERAEQFDPSTFQEENYKTQDPTVDELWEGSDAVGELQKLQMELQENKSYTDFDRAIIDAYISTEFDAINAYLWNTPYGDIAGQQEILKDDDTVYLDIPSEKGDYTEMTLKEYVDKLSGIIDKSPRLQQDTVIYRSGEFDTSLEVGKSGSFNGFMSTSFNEDFVKKWNNEINTGTSKDYVYKIYAPKGTKGVCPDTFEKMKQNEWILDRNQKFVVLSREDNGNPPTVEILLY